MEDMFKNEICVGDVCAKIYNYRDLQIVTAKKLNKQKCTFTDGSQGNYDQIFSLRGIGIEDAGKRHVEGEKTDALGNDLHVGDAVLFISSRGAYFHKGVIRSLAAQKITIEYEEQRFFKRYSDVLSLTAYGKDDFAPALPDWDKI